MGSRMDTIGPHVLTIPDGGPMPVELTADSSGTADVARSLSAWREPLTTVGRAVSLIGFMHFGPASLEVVEPDMAGLIGRLGAAATVPSRCRRGARCGS